MYLGVDVGSVSTDMVVMNDEGEVVASCYLPTSGGPIIAVQEGLREIEGQIDSGGRIEAVGTTGSGRHLAGVLVGADVVKNEITAHALAASWLYPDVQTVIEIGGQDSKIIIIRDGIPVDFAMNTVCAAGTGSFLDHQAQRLGISIREFGDYALRSSSSCRIAGRCTVFAESDMIHKQQLGYGHEDIIAGLSRALVRNYFNNVAKGKEILPLVVFQGGVAANQGIKHALEEELNLEIVVPKHHHLMGAIGAAMLAKEEVGRKGSTSFKGLEISGFEYATESFLCDGCPNSCEIVRILVENELIASWGSRCGKWNIEQ